jgi:hypothetical protein
MRRGGEGLLETSPSRPIPRDFLRQELIRTPMPPPPPPPKGTAGGSAAAVRKEMDRRTESKSSWNPGPPPASSRRMAELGVRLRRRRRADGSNRTRSPNGECRGAEAALGGRVLKFRCLRGGGGRKCPWRPLAREHTCGRVD